MDAEVRPEETLCTQEESCAVRPRAGALNANAIDWKRRAVQAEALLERIVNVHPTHVKLPPLVEEARALLIDAGQQDARQG